MAQKIFKGFMQVTEGTFTPETGYIYFVRKNANSGATDGYLIFNGKKYGTAAELEATLGADVTELSAVTAEIYADYLTSADRTNLENSITAETAARETLSGRVDTIETDYLSSADKTELNNAITAETAAREALSGRVDTIEADYLKAENLTAITANIEALSAVSADTRITALEAVSADSRLTAVESSAHTHDNKAVLDTIDQAKVNAWDAMAGGAAVVLSAYTGSDAGVTDGMLKSYEIFQGGVSVGKIDIPKDLVVTSGQVTTNDQDEKVLRLTIANQSEPVDILISDLAHVYTEGDGIEISSADTISAKVVAANGLSVDSNGIAMALADANGAGAMSAADFEKLASIAASADTNVLEGVQLNGVDVTIDANKKANIELPSATVSGSSNGVEVEVVESAGTITAVNVTAPDFAESSEFETLTGRVDTLEDNVAALSAVSADTRIAALENASADTRLDTLEAVSADSRITALEAVSANTRLEALEALTGTTSSAVQGVQLNGVDIVLDADKKANVELPSATVSGESNGVSVEVVESAGTLTAITVTAPDFANTYAGKSDFETLTGRVDTIEADYLKAENLTAMTADIEALSAVSADTRIAALEALTGSTNSALQGISAADATMSVGTKDVNNNQTVAVALSQASGNTLSIANDGLFSAIYYDGDDSN